MNPAQWRQIMMIVVGGVVSTVLSQMILEGMRRQRKTPERINV